MQTEKISFFVSDSAGTVSGEIMRPENPESVFVFAHGAGAGMDHPFMRRLSENLSSLGTATLRFNFPYTEKGRRRPDPPAIAGRAVMAAIRTAAERFPELPLLAGGKSFGGRMTSQILSQSPSSEVKGIVFVGFPLHAPGNPSKDRAEHLRDVKIPMLFLQGTRDALANIELIGQVCDSLPLATLKRFDNADHSFKAGKQDLIPALAETISSWSHEVIRQ